MLAVIAVIALEHLDQLPQHFAVKCVERVRPVQGDERHRAALLYEECIVIAHATVSASGNGVHSSVAGSGAKRTSSISSVTSSGLAGSHWGFPVLSIRSARPPSRKAWV